MIDDRDALEEGPKDFGPIPEDCQVWFEEFEQAGLDWQRFSPYHFRIEGLIDFWIPRGKWYVQFIDRHHSHLFERGVGSQDLIACLRAIQAELEQAA